MARFSTLLILVLISTAMLSSTLHAQHRKAETVAVHSSAGNVTIDRVSALGARYGDWKESNRVLRTAPELWNVAGLDIDQILAYGEHRGIVPGFRVSWDDRYGIPLAMSGSVLQHSMGTFNADAALHDRTAQIFFQKFASLLKLEPEAAGFVLSSVLHTENGRTHLRYRQEIEGIPVWGGEVVCGFTPLGDLDYFTGRYAPSSLHTEEAFLQGSDNALQSARSWLAARGVHDELEAGKYAVSAYSGPTTTRNYLMEAETLRPVWVVEMRTDALARWRIFVDARDGSVVRGYNYTCADGPEKATAKDLAGNDVTIDTYLHQGNYYMIDASRTMFNAGASVFPNSPAGAIVTLNANNSDLVNITQFQSSNNSWGDASSVSAHSNLGVVYEYYLSTHSRNSIDGKGGTIYAIVNVTDGGQSMENAYWNGQFMAFGNGGTVFDPIARALDVTAHELTHGVTEHTAGLEYLNQSGALNEAISDIFAAMVDRDDWLIGEEVTRTSSQFPNGALRDMQDPHNGGTQGIAAWQPKHMNEFVTLPENVDNGGVHINSGIINHAAYLLSEAIGRDKAEHIFYDALSTKLTRQSQFIDFRLSIIRSAQELYTQTEADACASACDQVGITDGNPTGDPTDYPPVDGIDRMLFVNTDPFLPAPLWIVTPPGGPNDFSSVSFTEVWSRPSITDDGTVAVFVDTDYNVRAIALDGPPNEQVIDNSEVWNSIAISKDENLLAVTTVLLNPEVYILDISGATPVAQSFDVYTPNYSGESVPNVAKFPDALDFSLDSRTLLFDTYNEIEYNGQALGFWDINVMDVWDMEADNFGTGRIDRIFPQDPDVNIGNAIYSRTKPTVIAFDVQYPGESEAYVVAMDLLEGKPVTVAQASFGTNGYPTYNGDDSMISFVGLSQDINVIYNVAMEVDGITPAGDPQGFVLAGTAPVWFRTGQRPVAVEATRAALPDRPVLGQNYPNPFNPSTSIPLQLARSMHARVSVHDMLGREVRILADEVFPAGTHVLRWNGRDNAGMTLPGGVYFVRLSAGETTTTKQMLYLK
ncbi:M4 family metallopeptidase [bacterium]|nr:M4 family metallopeptidase [bacterium]